MSIIFIDGDERQKYALQHLKSRGVSDVSLVKSRDVSKESLVSRAIILPLPVSTELTEITSYINADTLVIGGRFPPAVKQALSDRSIRYVDYYTNEDFQIKNAVLSAEGALFTAMQALKRSLHGSKIAVVGFGRIGKHLCAKLDSLGARVTACARKSADVAWAESFGYDTIRIIYSNGRSSLTKLSDDYDVIFNTVPSWIFDEDSASAIGRDTVFVELASAPFGMDSSIAKKYGLNYIMASGLPGKYAPASAGEIIGQAVFEILKEEGIVI